MKKKGPRGRKSKMHDRVPTSFDEVRRAIGKCTYGDEKTIKKKKK